MRLKNYLQSLLPNLYLKINLKEFNFKPKEIAESSGLSIKTARQILNGDIPPSIRLINAISKTKPKIWKKVFDEASLIKGKTCSNEIKIPKELNENIAYLMGAFRDGSMSRYKNEIEIWQKSKEWLKTIMNIFKKEFGTELKFKKRKGYFLIRIRSVALFELIKILFNYKKPNWITPELIKKAPIRLQKYYIAGFWDAEGSYSNKKGFSRISQNWSASKKCPPLEDLKIMLNKLNIKSNTYGGYKVKNSYEFYLYIPKKEFKKFLELIPLQNPKNTVF